MQDVGNSGDPNVLVVGICRAVESKLAEMPGSKATGGGTLADRIRFGMMDTDDRRLKILEKRGVRRRRSAIVGRGWPLLLLQRYGCRTRVGK